MCYFLQVLGGNQIPDGFTAIDVIDAVIEYIDTGNVWVEGLPHLTDDILKATTVRRHQCLPKNVSDHTRSNLHFNSPDIAPKVVADKGIALRIRLIRRLQTQRARRHFRQQQAQKKAHIERFCVWRGCVIQAKCDRGVGDKTTDVMKSWDFECELRESFLTWLGSYTCETNTSLNICIFMGLFLSYDDATRQALQAGGEHPWTVFITVNKHHKAGEKGKGCGYYIEHLAAYLNYLVSHGWITSFHISRLLNSKPGDDGFQFIALMEAHKRVGTRYIAMGTAPMGELVEPAVPKMALCKYKMKTTAIYKDDREHKDVVMFPVKCRRFNKKIGDYETVDKTERRLCETKHEIVLNQWSKYKEITSHNKWHKRKCIRGNNHALTIAYYPAQEHNTVVLPSNKLTPYVFDGHLERPWECDGVKLVSLLYNIQGFHEVRINL